MKIMRNNNMMKNSMLILFFVLVSATSVCAATFDTITDLGASARFIATGGVDGFSRSASSIFENPAALYRVDRAGFSFFTSTLMNEAKYNHVSFATETSLGRFAVGYMGVSVADIKHTGENQQNEFYVKSAFDYQNMVLKLAYQNSLSPDLHVGGSLVHYEQSFYDVAGSGNNVDLGLLWVQSWGQVSLSAKNLLWDGVVTYGDGKTETVATDVTLGYGHRFFEEFELMGQILHRQDSNLLSMGIVYTPTFLSYVSVMGGYREYMVLNETRNKMAMGLGLHLAPVDFYYSYEKSDHIEFDGKHSFSVDVNL
jgi:hypothetical protein